MVAGADSPRHLLFHINGTQIRRHLNLHMIHVLCYCDEAQASLCKCADSPEPSLHASICNIDTYCIVQWLYLCKCADSTESKLLAWIKHKSPFEPAHDISLLWRGSGEPLQMCRLAGAFAASIWNIDTYCIVQWLYLCKCADSPESTLLGWIAHKSPFEAAYDVLLQWRRLR